jgi:hypothetical protein
MFDERPSETERAQQSGRSRRRAVASRAPGAAAEHGMREALLELIDAESSA